MAPWSWWADPEHDLGRLDRRQPQGQGVVEGLGPADLDAPQRVLGQLLDADALDLGVGELELHPLEPRRAAGRTAGGPARSARVRSMARSSMPSRVQHGSTSAEGHVGAPVPVAERLEVERRPRRRTSAAGRVGGPGAVDRGRAVEGDRDPPPVEPVERRRGRGAPTTTKPVDLDARTGGRGARPPGTAPPSSPALRHSAAAASSSSASGAGLEVPGAELGRAPGRPARAGATGRPRRLRPARRHRPPRRPGTPGARTRGPRRSARSS